jgi:hypothetical protein
MDEQTQFDKEQREFEGLANEALDEACYYIQRKLRVQTGDFASLFFSDGVVVDLFKKYINEEVYLNILSKDQLIERLIKDDIKKDFNGGFLDLILKDGFIGYKNQTLEELKADWFQRLENR